MAELVHGAAVAVDGRGVLILGPSGSGKSGLALDLIARGAVLIADDGVKLTPGEDGPPRASPHAAIRGRIEARGIGILRTDWTGGVPVALAVDLGRGDGARLPPPRRIALMGHAVPLLWAKDAPNLAVAIIVALKGGLETHE
ncbi:MAG: HPr kinase/phosphatase C-terminal domain-containing protein [Paracoccaceae bacterium]|nr:HPr kinase/phosphatase C-terminal domain-containing protein [Paracoccaceae bacterium]